MWLTAVTEFKLLSELLTESSNLLYISKSDQLVIVIFCDCVAGVEYNLRQCNSIPIKCILTNKDTFLGDFQEENLTVAGISQIFHDVVSATSFIA